QVISGEGVWTFWREWKPGSCEALNDGWSPLRWCLFADTLHGYSGHKFKFETILANEDVLGPGVYPICLRVSGPEGVVWEKKINFEIAQPANGKEIPLAIQCSCDEVVIDGADGEYEFAACMERGGAPAGGRLKFNVFNAKDYLSDEYSILTWGIDSKTQDWLKENGVNVEPFSGQELANPNIILVGQSSEMKYDEKGWRTLIEHIARGGMAVFLTNKAFEKGLVEPVFGKLERTGPYRCMIRDFKVDNMPQDQWPMFSKEFYCDITYLASELPDDEYTIELGMSQVLIGENSSRIFNVDINENRVLEKFDIIKETDNKRLAVIRTFTAKPDNGKIKIDFTSEPLNAATISRLRIYDSNKQLIMEDSAYTVIQNELAWLPLKNKGRCTQFDDWLYHKDCVAKLHPIFRGMQKGKGVMDWDYYGPVIPKTIMEDMEISQDIAAVSFAVGYPVEDGYLSGILNASYLFGRGAFMVNTLNITDNICLHPAAGKLLLNMIKYSAGKLSDTLVSLPDDFDTMLRDIGYDD
ncbi:MAG: hypothetical protein KAH17_00750, partial [Bacteroidales bacterium]|nr:hypothetical protein [Bacteroidales bacterium]